MQWWEPHSLLLDPRIAGPVVEDKEMFIVNVSLEFALNPLFVLYYFDCKKKTSPPKLSMGMNTPPFDVPLRCRSSEKLAFWHHSKTGSNFCYSTKNVFKLAGGSDKAY
jgi:hypothetical protein